MCGSARFGTHGFVRLSPGLLISLRSTKGPVLAPLSIHRFARIERSWWSAGEVMPILDMYGFMEKDRAFDVRPEWSVMAVLHEPISDEDRQTRTVKESKVVSLLTTGVNWVLANIRDPELLELYRQVFEIHHRCPVVWSEAA